MTSLIGLCMPAGSGSCPSSASLGAVDAECRQEVEAAHPAPAWGRWMRNASMKRGPRGPRGLITATRLSASTAPELALDGRLPLHWPVEPGNF